MLPGGLPDQLSGLLVSVSGPVGLYPGSVNRVPLSLGIVRVELVHEVVAGELLTNATVPSHLILRTGIGGTGAPERLALDRVTTSAFGLSFTGFPFT